MPTTHRWVAKAKAVAELYTITATASNNATYTLTIAGKNVTITADASATAAEIYTALYNAMTSTTNPPPDEFLELEWTDNTTSLAAAGITPGLPITMTGSASAGSLTVTETTAASGPNFANVAANWSSGSVPVTGDTIYIDGVDEPILYGLAMSGVTLVAIYFRKSGGSNFTTGLPKTNSAGYPEYRADYWAISATTCIVDSDSGRIKIDFGSVQTSVSVLATGSPLETNVHALVLKGTHASNALDSNGGFTDVAPFGNETSTFATVTAINATVRCGNGVTIGTWEQGNSQGEINPAATVSSATAKSGGVLRILGNATITDLFAIDNARVAYNGAGTVTEATVKGGGVLDLSEDISPCTFGSVVLDQGGTFNDPVQRATITSGFTTADGVKSLSAT